MSATLEFDPAQWIPALAEIESAAQIVYRSMPPTPQYRWPLLEERTGGHLWVKHENHTPVGAFKVRGGLVYFDELAHAKERPAGVICATRGNHGQSVAFGALKAGLPATVVVPLGNSPEKNAAVRALGARLIEHGNDFQESLEHAMRLAGEQHLHFIHSFHRTLVRGTATIGLELFRGREPLDVVYCPVGLGSNICGMIAAREALGLRTEIVGVVAENAPAVAISLERDAITSAPANTLADGIACRTPNTEAFAVLRHYRTRIVRVSETQITEAMRMYFTDTHNVAEGAGAASLAAALADPQRGRYHTVGTVLTGGNVDMSEFAAIIA